MLMTSLAFRPELAGEIQEEKHLNTKSFSMSIKHYRKSKASVFDLVGVVYINPAITDTRIDL